jgi:hypothetical protein
MLDLPESRTRRLLELKLLHQYTTKTSLTLSGSTEPVSLEVFTTILPRLALKHDALLYAIYSISSLHLAKCEPGDPEAIDAYQRYLDLALREHRNEINNLSKDTADSAVLTSALLRACAFVMLHDRQLNPYTPPAQWLQMTSSAVNIFSAVWRWIADDESSIATRLIQKTPYLVPHSRPNSEVVFGEANRQGLLHLLRRSGTASATEPWPADVQEAYETTISYIGSVQTAIAEGEAPSEIRRRLVLFPVLIQKRFIELVIERQPRALVVLAHFFALLVKFRDVWWIGDTGEREVRGIQSVLSDEWQDLMSWPLLMLKDQQYPD